MRTFDFAPLYRSVVGFDRLAGLLEAAQAETASTGYPPYNIERTAENEYRIEIAVAGFRPDELNVEVKENLLTVQGRKAANDEARQYRIAVWPSVTSSAASSWPTTSSSPTPS